MKYEIRGRTEAGAPTILLSAGLGGAGSYWQPQLDALAPQLRVVLYDQRGTGRNREPLPEGYSIAHMVDDVIGILDEAEIGRCHFMGHALGGLVGLELARRCPERLDRLVLVNAWDRLDTHTARCFAVRQRLLDAGGAEAYVQAQPLFLYPAAWLSEHAEWVAQEEAHGVRHFQGRDTLLKRIAALRAFDVSSQLGDIQTSTLVVATRDDVLVPWTASQRLAQGLPNAHLHLFDHGGHASNITDPAAFNSVVTDFLYL
ncbi:pyrimidine utilization protein D [Ramlibacter sp. Leaf400]|uniref:pyrimidine utilization protein D n=1 Tax=Ramlibacter sp. Leaf400 TaxID=1736365 RepID=UPI0006F39CEE|nr:pyrimidine utilization protein D [Ramlibacter sp. Leaf400]KQT11228.1 pyrimidine utilization protein D [Ramlibacter sp. Leaf400]